MGNISDTVGTFYDTPNDRYKSWEHCYEQFNNPNADKKYDSLHLAFYLASWGMYRGSSFLLQKDYTVHEKVALMIRTKQAVNEFDINFKDLSLADSEKIESTAVKINTIFKDVKSCYGDCAPKVSNILISKILMGTVGITPAFDRFYISGAKKEFYYTGVSAKENIKLAIEFYLKHKNKFDDLSKDIGYPVMKLVDMYFWQKGYEMSNNSTKENECGKHDI